MRQTCAAVGSQREPELPMRRPRYSAVQCSPGTRQVWAQRREVPGRPQCGTEGPVAYASRKKPHGCPAVLSSRPAGCTNFREGRETARGVWGARREHLCGPVSAVAGYSGTTGSGVHCEGIWIEIRPQKSRVWKRLLYVLSIYFLLKKMRGCHGNSDVLGKMFQLSLIHI